VLAEVVKLAVMSTTSWQAPVMIGEVDVYDIPRASKRGVRSRRRGEACDPGRESRGMARLTATFTSAGSNLLE
jgi:hypothetical protein